jgi:uracil-DNA glycosylase
MPGGIKATATFHPAYILRQRGADRQRLLELARQDFAAVKQALTALGLC